MVGSYAADLLRSAGQAPEPMPSLTDGTGSWIETALVMIDDHSNFDVRVVGRLAPGELAAYNSGADVRWLHDPPNLDGSTIVRWDASTNPGRNDPCPCGSGIKYKRCHGVSG